jgi:hypothetical protein
VYLALARSRHERKCYPLLLSVFFLAIGYDELFQIHEHISNPVREILPIDGLIFLRYSWVIPYSLLVILVASLGLKFLAFLPKKISYLFILAGFVYVIGELGLEFVSSGVDFLAHTSPHKLRYQVLSLIIMTAEETLGMLGMAIFNYALLVYLRELGPDFKVSFRGSSEKRLFY